MKFLVVLVFQNKKLFSISFPTWISNPLLWFPLFGCFYFFLRVFLTSFKVFLSWPFCQFVEIFCCYLGQFVQVRSLSCSSFIHFRVHNLRDWNTPCAYLFIFWVLVVLLWPQKVVLFPLKEKAQKTLLLFIFFQVFGFWFLLF